jgi:hypothetical protein
MHATLIQAGDVRPCAVQPPFQFVSFPKKLVLLRKKVLVFLAETVSIVFDPGAIRLAVVPTGRRGVAAESKASTEVAYFVFGIERPLSPGRFLLDRRGLDAVLARAWLLACAAAIIWFAASFS